MKNKNNKRCVKKTQEEIIDSLIDRMEELGMSIDGFKHVITEIEKRKAQLNEVNHEEECKQDNIDEKIKIVRRTMSSEVENGIVMAASTDKNGSLSDDSVFYAKGSVLEVISMVTTGLLGILDNCNVSLDEYIKYLQSIPEESDN